MLNQRIKHYSTELCYVNYPVGYHSVSSINTFQFEGYPIKVIRDIYTGNILFHAHQICFVCGYIDTKTALDTKVKLSHLIHLTFIMHGEQQHINFLRLEGVHALLNNDIKHHQQFYHWLKSVVCFHMELLTI